MVVDARCGRVDHQGFQKAAFFSLSCLACLQLPKFDLTCNIERSVSIGQSRDVSQSAKMVYYFTSNTVSPAAFVYVGKDKVESENLRDEQEAGH